MKILVTAGGQGTKMWPYSRQDKPKQFQAIIGGESSYQHNINLLLKEFTPEDIYISTKHRFIRYISEQSPQIPLKNYIVEPDIAKDRGPGEGLAFLYLSMMHPNEPFFLVQADCYREPGDQFLSMIHQAEQLVTQHKKLVTGGIKATEPSVGVDYLQLGAALEDSAYIIDQFVFRKETIKETRELIQKFSVVTHCNHMCWYPELILEAYEQHRPDWHAKLMEIKSVIGQPGEREAIERIYQDMEKGPTEDVTTHVMNSGEAIVLLLPYKWTDLGTWTSIYEFFADGTENYTDGNIIVVDSKGSLVKSSSPGKLVAVAGVDDIVVVDTDDALLVIPKDKIDKIKEIQEEIKLRQQVNYL